MGTNCATLVADLFLYCYERDFMDSLNHDNQADVIEAFNSTSRHRRSTTGLLFFFFAVSPVWRPLRYVHAIILPLKPFLSILNQPSSMGYYIDKVGNAVS